MYYLQQDSKVATGLLIASVDQLQGSTARITNHLDRLQTVEKDLVALRTAAAGKDDVGKVRAEVKKDYVSGDCGNGLVWRCLTASAAWRQPVMSCADIWIARSWT